MTGKVKGVISLIVIWGLYTQVLWDCFWLNTATGELSDIISIERYWLKSGVLFKFSLFSW